MTGKIEADSCLGPFSSLLEAVEKAVFLFEESRSTGWRFLLARKKGPILSADEMLKKCGKQVKSAAHVENRQFWWIWRAMS